MPMTTLWLDALENGLDGADLAPGEEISSLPRSLVSGSYFGWTAPEAGGEWRVQVLEDYDGSGGPFIRDTWNDPTVDWRWWRAIEGVTLAVAAVTHYGPLDAPPVLLVSYRTLLGDDAAI